MRRGKGRAGATMNGMTSHLGARPEFVGRETQLRALQSAVDAGEMGERVLVLVAGEPGIGKSRLVAEVARRTSAHAVSGRVLGG